MHQWEDNGIVISVTRYGEQSAIVRFLTQEHGLFPCMVKGALSKANRGMYQPGNLLHIHWQARIEEQLGHAKGELLQSITAELLQDGLALQVINAMGALVTAAVPERIKEKELFILFSDISSIIKSIHYDKTRLMRSYAEFEYALLQELGFGLDLDECAATGRKDDLIYVSPKSGRAVCREAGEPYKARMLALPPFLKTPESHAEMSQILDALTLTGYFLEGWVLQPEGRKMPDARQRLLMQINSSIESE